MTRRTLISRAIALPWALAATAKQTLAGAAPVSVASAPVTLANLPNRWSHRLKWNAYERVWLAFWKKENSPPMWKNGGTGVLEHLLGKEPSPEQVQAVEAVIQWFGSNVGSSFIEEALRLQGASVKIDYNDKNRVLLSGLLHDAVWNGKELPEKIILNKGGGYFQIEV